MASFLAQLSCLWLLCTGGFLRAVDAPGQHLSVLMGGKADFGEHDVVELRKGSQRISRFDGELHNEAPYENRLRFDRTSGSYSWSCPMVEDSGRYTYSVSSKSSAAADELFTMIHIVHVIDPGMENQTVLLGELGHFNESCMIAKLFMSIGGINSTLIATYHGGLHPVTPTNFNVTFNVNTGSFELSNLTPADSAFYRTEIFEDIDSKLHLISNITEHLQVVPASDGSSITRDNKTLDGTHRNNTKKNHSEDGQTSHHKGLVIFAVLTILICTVFTAFVYGLYRNRWILHRVANLQKNILGICYRTVGSTEQHLNEGTELEMNALNSELETVTESPGSLHVSIN